MISARHRFAYSKTYLLYTAPGAAIVSIIWLGFVGLLVHGVLVSNPNRIIVGLFGAVAGFFLVRVSVRSFRGSLHDYRVSKAQRRK